MMENLFAWENGWMDDLGKMLRLDLGDPAVLHRIARIIRRMSDGFTGRGSAKELSGLYGNDAGFREGYGAYYLAVNVPKHVYLFERHEPIRRVRRLLDIGCGPGTAVLGWLLSNRRDGVSGPVSFDVLDKSVGFLKMARRNIRFFMERLSVEGSVSSIPWSISRGAYRCRNPYPLVISSNLLGEIGDDRLKSVADTLACCVEEGGCLVMLEPALRLISRRMLNVRDMLLSGGFEVLDPCPGSYPCPALKTTDDWCHHRISWDPPHFIRVVDRMTGLNKKRLNFSYCILIRRGNRSGVGSDVSTFSGTDYLVVSDQLKRFGGKAFYLCGGGIRRGAVLLKKNICENNREFLSLKRYDQVRILDPEEEGDYLKIGPETVVLRLKDWSRPE